jgi:hypothetical protein
MYVHPTEKRRNALWIRDNSIQKPRLQAETPPYSEALNLSNFLGFLRDPGLRPKGNMF